MATIRRKHYPNRIPVSYSLKLAQDPDAIILFRRNVRTSL